MKFTKSFVVALAAQAKEFTSGLVSMKAPESTGKGCRYRDGRTNTVWAAGYAARRAAAFYVGAAQGHSLRMGKKLPESLAEAAEVLGEQWQPKRVRDAFEGGHAFVERQAQEARRNVPRAQVGERRRLTLVNRDELIGWSGGREPYDPDSDVLVIDNPGGSTVIVARGQTVEYTAHGFRMRPYSNQAPTEPPAGVDVVAYVYGGKIHHPDCAIQALQDGHPAFDARWPGPLPGDRETALDRLAAALGIDRHDRTSFAESAFPKSVLGLHELAQVMPLVQRVCGNCRLPIAEPHGEG
jgi:hypothetical protein